jgi:hypothetical protein
MEVDFKLYFWMTRLGLFEDSSPRDERSKHLPREIAQKFSSGFLMAKVLESLKEKVKPEISNQTNFDFVKDTLKDEEIRQNWNFLLAVLNEGYAIRLDGNTREILMEGDKQMICEIFDILYEK